MAVPFMKILQGKQGTGGGHRTQGSLTLPPRSTLVTKCVLPTPFLETELLGGGISLNQRHRECLFLPEKVREAEGHRLMGMNIVQDLGNLRHAGPWAGA